MERIKEEELEKGLLGPIIVDYFVSAADTTERVIIKGGQHPKMKLVCDANMYLSYVMCLFFTSADATVTIKKGAERLAIAASAGGLTDEGVDEKFTPTALAAGITEERYVIQPEDDVVLLVGASGNAATVMLAHLYFERVG